jgi:hypothetical protein
VGLGEASKGIGFRSLGAEVEVGCGLACAVPERVTAALKRDRVRSAACVRRVLWAVDAGFELTGRRPARDRDALPVGRW